MTDTNNHNKLRRNIEKQVSRMQQAEKDRPTILAQSAFIGVLALLFVLPVIGGAYLGNWLDSNLEGYSMRWTLSLLVLGIIVGVLNVYLYIREH